MRRKFFTLSSLILVLLCLFFAGCTSKDNTSNTITKADIRTNTLPKTNPFGGITAQDTMQELNIINSNTSEAKDQPLDLSFYSLSLFKKDNSIMPVMFDTFSYLVKTYDILPTEWLIAKHTGVALLIDKQSVKHKVPLSITPLTTEDMALLPGNLVNLTSYHNGYRFLPDGQTFERDIAIAMVYDTMDIPFGYTSEDIYTFYYNNKSMQWEKIERDSVDELNHIVYSRTNHFTDYINGILKTPETSDAMAYTPTSIKDLKAAEPLNGITMMSPPQANNKGTANLNYPITIPQGRRGMQPDLNITYNSSGGSSWLGLGWDLSVSCISVETRWGVPLYNEIYETETYLLDGETLVTGYEDENDKLILNKPAYRRDFDLRYADGMQFYPRVEGAFKTIIRHGTTPQNYWWEVIDKNGTRYFYGKKIETNELNPNSVLSSISQDIEKRNIAKWYLTEVRDVYNNNIKYNYNTFLSNENTIGQQVYLSNINYTGQGDQLGNYNISFTIDTERKDATNSGRYGFKEVNDLLLKKIDIISGMTDTINTICFAFTEGAFGKTLLCSFVELDSLERQGFDFSEACFEQPKLKKHIFEYEYESINNSFNFLRKIYTKEFSDISLDELNRFSIVNKSNIGGSVSTNFNIGIGANIGIGTNPFLKWLSVGGNYSYNYEDTKGTITLIDINGDGYPDKLYKNIFGGISYRLFTPNENDEISLEPYYFSNSLNQIDNINNFLSSFSSTHNWGVEAQLKTPTKNNKDTITLGAGGNIGWGTTKTSTKTYFTDINGDGLIDIVEGGKMYINKLVYGLPTFTDMSKEDTIKMGGVCGDYILNNIDVDEDLFRGNCNIIQQSLFNPSNNGIEQCPPGMGSYSYDTCNYNNYTYMPDIDPVRTWISPYDGFIKIVSTAKLSPDWNSLRERKGIRDGVKISISKNSNSPLYNRYLSLYPFNNEHNQTLDNIEVHKGDRIYFRMESLSSREYDKIYWDPVINYQSVADTSVEYYQNLTDANGDKIFVFRPTTDFVVNGGAQKIHMPISGKIIIDVFLNIPTSLNEDLRLEIIKNNTHIIDTTFNQNTYIGNASYSSYLYYPNGEIQVNKNDSIWFKLSSSGQVKWQTVNAKAKMYYVDGNNEDQTDISVVDEVFQGTPENPKYIFTYYPIIEKTTYNYQKQPSKKLTTPVGVVNFIPNLTTHQIRDNGGEVKVVIKTNFSTLYACTYYYTNYYNNIANSKRIYKKNQDGTTSLLFAGSILINQELNDIITLNIPQGTEYYIDYYVPHNDLNMTFNTKLSGQTALLESGLYTNYHDSVNAKYCSIYRNWGQFGYKSDLDYIDESLLVYNYNANFLSTQNYSTTQEDDDNARINFPNLNIESLSNNPETNIEGVNPLSGHYFPMFPDYEKNAWAGYCNINYINKDTMCNVINYVSDSIKNIIDYPVPIITGQTGAKTIYKQSINKPYYNLNGNMNIGSFELSGSKSKGEMRVLSDYMDVNGDSYPDIISESEVQLTKPQGGLGNKKIVHVNNSESIDFSSYESTGIAAGGTLPKISRVASNGDKKGDIKMSGNVKLLSNSSSDLVFTWIDINGDGLPDKVSRDNGEVYLNYGTYFGKDISWNTPQSMRSSVTTGGCFGSDATGEIIQTPFLTTNFNISNRSLSGGISANSSKNITERELIDINGDGLFDLVYIERTPLYWKLFVKFNLGKQFDTVEYLLHQRNIWTSGYGAPNSISHDLSLNGSFSFGFSLFGCLNFIFNPQAGGGYNLNNVMQQFTDLNNDGCPDYLFDQMLGSNDITGLFSLTIAKANLLREVTLPTDSKIKIDYEMPNSTTESSKRHWVMSKVLLTEYGVSSTASADIIKTTYSYKNRKYDRFEREDYGFDTVITMEWNVGAIERKIISSYHNSNYMFKGIKKIDCIIDAQGNKKLETFYNFGLHEISTGNIMNMGDLCKGSVYPNLLTEEQKHYEGQSILAITTLKEFKYGKYGNVKYYKDYGITVANDSVSSYIDYHENLNKYIVGISDTITVKVGNTVLRKRFANIGQNGEMVDLTIINNGNNSKYFYNYDTYGNISRTILPPNSNGQSLQIDYKYDPVVHTYPTQVNNSLGYTSSAIYDYRWGKPIETTDIAGNKIKYTYDKQGRISTIRGPKEIASGQLYTIKYEYYNLPGSYIYWSRTSHYDPEHPTNDIKTVTFSDRLGRILQIKKDIEIGGVEKRAISGRVIYDDFGRVINQYQPKEEDVLIDDTIFNASFSTYYTTTTYDVLDRPLQVTYPDMTTSQNAYGFGQDVNSIKRFKTITTDQNGKQTTIYSDHRQLKTQITAANNTSTQFEYDALGQLSNSIDPEGQPTSYEYDMMGRRTGRNHPSAGQTNWSYDQAGNLTKQTMSSGEEISYNYNFNQLINVSYLDKYWNDVWYKYGGTGSGNQTGRLIKQQDATGVQEFEYGNMGELIRNRHTYVVPNSEAFTFTTEWEYDSWNRVKQIIYPDNETVTYSYNLGGLLKHVEGYKPNIGTTVYIEDITYDKYEQRTAVINGNQTRTYYTYDPKMLRMTNLETINPNGDLLKLEYAYDLAGNITQIKNTGLNPYVQDYTYDDIYQLKSAHGDWNNTSIDYNLYMSYSPSGKILKKDLGGQRIDNQGTDSLDYENIYDYGVNGNPYALKHIIDNNTGNEHFFNWDEKGNMINHIDKSIDNERHLCWTEDNRLQAVKDNQMGAYYNYDATGERNLKLTGGILEIIQNGQTMYSPVLTEQTLYASALVTVNDKGYTKHYFEEGKRICSKIGSGELQNVNQKVDHMEMDYEEQRSIQTEGITITYEGCMEITPYINNANLYETIINKYETQVNSGEPIFYYHSDHLGSASFLTDSSGAETQQLVYLPFGEDWVDMKYNVSQFETPYKFNGKEKDQETGYNYFGARYYTDWASIWLSVDPLSDKYPHLTSYNYCANNPIMLVDPDGRETFSAPIYDTHGNFLGTDNQGLQGKAIVMNKKNFTQGMSHDKALKNNLGVKGLSSDDAKVKLNNHYSGLKNRPDWDGKLTFDEATKWSNQGNGKPLFVDGSKIDLSPKTVNDVKDAAKKNNGYIDFFDDGKGNYDTGRVYGNIKVTLTNEKTGEVILGKNGYLDKHDFSNPVFRAINDMYYKGDPKVFKIYCAPCNNKVDIK